MTYAPAPLWLPPSVSISSGSREAAGELWKYFGLVSSGTWISANRAIYFPVHLTTTITVQRMFWLNGATAATNNLDVGIYTADSDGKPASLIVSGGGTLASGANACQFVNIADTTLFGPALYYMALVANGTTTTVFRSTTLSTIGSYYTVFSQNTAYTLPSTATPVPNAAAFFPAFGMSQRASP